MKIRLLMLGILILFGNFVFSQRCVFVDSVRINGFLVVNEVKGEVLLVKDLDEKLSKKTRRAIDRAISKSSIEIAELYSVSNLIKNDSQSLPNNIVQSVNYLGLLKFNRLSNDNYVVLYKKGEKLCYVYKKFECTIGILLVEDLMKVNDSFMPKYNILYYVMNIN